MEFLFDPSKSMGNLAKHGISFKDAQLLWEDSRLQIIKARTESEPRWIAIGLLGKKHWSAVWTPRGDAIQIISVRRSRPKEIELYES